MYLFYGFFLWERLEVPTKTNSELIASQPIITVKEARKLLGIASKNVPDAELERVIVLLEEIASTFIQEKSFQ
ncbi:hypothetical protein BH23PAT2_BH23PAT2_04180 [soil metagenome]